jgi:ubiquinone biosynthesis UbiH/UbiF/VisC/COQ6 family hydroxylase
MDVDIVIVGGGLAGASLAAALAPSALRLALIERKAPAAPAPEWDSRIYALTPASSAFLHGVGAWERIEAGRSAPIHEMHVFGDDGRSRLDFSAYDSGVPELATTVESARLHYALWQGLQRQRNLSLLCPEAPSGLVRRTDRVEIGLSDGGSVSAKLVVGADGADSWLRRAAGIDSTTGSYGQRGIVANFSCGREHRGAAYQWFRNDGVLAFLPLPGQRMSIVWSTPDESADELLALPAAEFGRRVSRASGEVLGRLELITSPAAFPLSRLSVRSMIQPRIALVGDAAHVVHPLAGQGVNLGFGDALSLAALLGGARDPGDYLLLRRFERSRAEDILALRWVTHGLFRLFDLRHPIAARIRNFGLNLTNSNTVIKTLLARRAIGLGGELPRKETT